MPKLTAKALTELAVSKYKPTDKEQQIPDSRCKGLYLLIQPSGHKSWAVRYRIFGKPQKLTIGKVEDIPLDDARKRADKIIDAVKAGRDPLAEKAEKAEQEKDLDEHPDAFPVVLAAFIRFQKRTNSPRYAKESEQMFEREVAKRWKNKKITDITRRDISRVLDEMVEGVNREKEIPVMANRLFSQLRRLFNWSIEKGFMDYTPMFKMPAPHDEDLRTRKLSDDELRWLWQASDEIEYPFGPIVKLLMITAQRRTEVGSARWREFELDGNMPMWTIPPERAKNKNEHMLPLTGMALEVIKTVPMLPQEKTDFLFTTTLKTPVSGWGRCKESLDAAMLAIAQKQAIERGEDPDKVEIESWILHDIRRTIATKMGKLGVLPHVGDVVLNHVSGEIKGVTRRYNQHDYLEKKEEALVTWSEALKVILAGGAGSNVIPLRREA